MAREITEFLLNKFSSLLEEAKAHSREHAIGVPLISRFQSIDRTIKSKVNGIWNLEDQSALEINRLLHDVIDDLSECLLLARRRDAAAALKKGRLHHFLPDALAGFNMRYSIRKMKNELLSKEKRFNDLNLSRSQEDSLSLSSFLLDQTIASFPDPEKPIGLDEAAKEIKSLLIDENRVSYGRLNTLGIVGMGGSGKTALAHMVFEEIKSKFGISMWICLSETLKDHVDIRADLVKQMLHLMGFEVDEFPFEYELFELLKILKTKLEGKRYLLVLDDVWNVDEWYVNLGNEIPKDERIEDKLSDGLPKGDGSLIIVTSRIGYVAAMMVGKDNIFNINNNGLSDEAIWSIFSTNFGSNKKSETIEKMKDDIIEYCSGLPLVAKALAETLSEHYFQPYLENPNFRSFEGWVPPTRPPNR